MNIIKITKNVVENFFSNYKTNINNVHLSRLFRTINYYIDFKNELKVEITCLNKKKHHIKSIMVPKDIIVDEMIITFVDYDVYLVVSWNKSTRMYDVSIFE